MHNGSEKISECCRFDRVSGLQRNIDLHFADLVQLIAKYSLHEFKSGPFLSYRALLTKGLEAGFGQNSAMGSQRNDDNFYSYCSEIASTG